MSSSLDERRARTEDSATGDRSGDGPEPRRAGTTTTSDDGGDGATPRRRRPSLRMLIVVAVVVVLALFATWLVVLSPAFTARDVTVRGIHTETVSDIEQTADIDHSTPLVRLDTAAIERRVERLNAVADARVTTSFPSTVVITVTERTPVGYVVVYGHPTLVDRTGAQYRELDATPKHLPKFVVPSGTDLRSAGSAVATVARALPAALLAQVKSIEALDPRAITLVLRGGQLVHWGGAARSTDKARIVEVLRHRHVDRIDVTDPDQPFTR